MEELREALRNHLAQVAELKGASIGLSNPEQLQKFTQGMNRLSTALQTAKTARQGVEESGEDIELVSMQIAGDLNAILRKQ